MTGWQQIFFFLPSIQTRSRAHFALSDWVLVAAFLAAEQQGYAADRFYRLVLKLKKSGDILLCHPIFLCATVLS